MTYRNRDMATGPFPVQVTPRRVVLEGTWSGGSYNTWVSGIQVLVTLSDGSEVFCRHLNGHKTDQTFRDCATKLVRDLNDAAGIPREKQ